MPEVLISKSDGQALFGNFVRLLNGSDQHLAMIIIGASRTEEMIGEVLSAANLPCQSWRAADNIKNLHDRGLIDEDTRDCLLDLFQIRGYFAHSSKNCSLGDNEIQSFTRRLVALLERGFQGTSAVRKLMGKIQAELDSQAGPGHSWAGSLSEDGEKIRMGFFFLWCQLLAAKQSAVGGSSVPIQFGQFTVKTGR